MSAVRRPRPSRLKEQQLVRRPVPMPVDDSDDWTNTSANCQDDAIQVIVNNSKGKEKEVNFRIVNRGTCPVRVAVTAGRNTGAIDKLSQRIPGGTKERVNVTVPAGHFLKATCTGNSKDGCDWTISDLKC